MWPAGLFSRRSQHHFFPFWCLLAPRTGLASTAVCLCSEVCCFFLQERPKPQIPVRHFRDAAPPFVICVKLVSTAFSLGFRCKISICSLWKWFSVSVLYSLHVDFPRSFCYAIDWPFLSNRLCRVFQGFQTAGLSSIKNKKRYSFCKGAWIYSLAQQHYTHKWGYTVSHLASFIPNILQPYVWQRLCFLNRTLQAVLFGTANSEASSAPDSGNFILTGFID